MLRFLRTELEKRPGGLPIYVWFVGGDEDKTSFLMELIDVDETGLVARSSEGQVSAYPWHLIEALDLV